jgi:ribosomal protein L37E
MSRVVSMKAYRQSHGFECQVCGDKLFANEQKLGVCQSCAGFNELNWTRSYQELPKNSLENQEAVEGKDRFVEAVFGDRIVKFLDKLCPLVLVIAIMYFFGHLIWALAK